jgi:hypothetical protein
MDNEKYCHYIFLLQKMTAFPYDFDLFKIKARQMKKEIGTIGLISNQPVMPKYQFPVCSFAFWK